MSIFPDYGDPLFQEKISRLQEYQYFGVPAMKSVATEKEYEKRVEQACGGFEKAIYQHLVQHYLSWRSPYKGILLYHGLGVGKTCSSITLAEALLTDHNARMGPRIWVILPNALQKPYEDQILNGACLGDKYEKMVKDKNDLKKLQSIVKSRYTMFTYEGFANEMARLKATKDYKEAISNKVIIVDEAHNLRIQESDKRAAQALVDVATDGENNKIALLTATPMYNEPDEIFWLLAVLCANDKRKGVLDPKRLPALYNAKGVPNKATMSLLRQLASEYISYMKGRNPFTFAARLSPRDSGIPLYEEGTEWTKYIRDGLVPTPCSQFQIESIDKMKKGDSTHHQALNVCYPNVSGVATTGKNGFLSVFKRETDTDPLNVSYITPEAKQLFPTSDKLGRIAPKIQRICDLIRKSEGIVVIYSQFVWSGVFPVAIALEHMGFKRHGAGIRNILKNAETVADPVRYPGVPFPTYCILSGETAAMGNTKIDDLLKDINSPRNKHGETVKVVIMSPVAGEGLSLRNVREVHILDPWYHLNRLEQVIGRAFRTCQHLTLPIQERNATVFLHVATHPDSAEITTDINSYQIAARKAQQSEDAEAIIRDAAVDCSLLKNVNYFPKDMFEFDIVIRSSRGVPVPYHFGDDSNKAPKCSDPSLDADNTTVRKEVYKDLIPTGIVRLKKYILGQNKSYFTYQELQDAIGMHPMITKSVLLEATHDKKFNLFIHRNGFVVQSPPDNKRHRPLKIHVSAQTADASAIRNDNDECADNEVAIASQATENKSVGKILIYKVLNSKCWPSFAKKIIEYGDNIPANIAPHVALLYEEGAFIGANEIPRYKAGGKRYIGYVDIFDVDNRFNVIVYDSERALFRGASDAEIVAIKAARTEKARPTDRDTLHAIMEPHKYKKLGADNPVTNELKILAPSATGTQKGIVCESIKKNETLRYLRALNPLAKNGIKEQVCFSLALELEKRGLLYFAPAYKPKAT